MNVFLSQLLFYYHFILANYVLILMFLASLILLSFVRFRLSRNFEIKGIFLSIFIVSSAITLATLYRHFYPAIVMLLFFLVYYFAMAMYETKRTNFHVKTLFFSGIRAVGPFYYVLFFIFVFVPFIGAVVEYSYYHYWISVLDIGAMAYTAVFLVDLFVSLFYLSTFEDAKESVFIMGYNGAKDYLSEVFIIYAVFFVAFYIMELAQGV
ncbi:MAG: hypothetical protein GPW19_03055 [Euryarchaeota archaeon]|nr:hypothetical protein [Euryarchaeota archaeon]